MVAILTIITIVTIAKKQGRLTILSLTIMNGYNNNFTAHKTSCREMFMVKKERKKRTHTMTESKGHTHTE